jgi:hypothetical protein
MSDVVWSINIMLALLLVGVGVIIYWIFKYDDWNPNPIITSEHESDSELTLNDESRRSDSTDERVEVRTGTYAH